MTSLVRCLVVTAAVFLAFGQGSTALAQDTPAFTSRSAKSGPWSDPATRAPARVPKEGDRVLVGLKTRVLYDVESAAVIRYVQVAGTLSFARDKSTTLNVGVVTIQATNEYSETGFDCTAHVMEAPAHKGQRAALEVGTPEAPIPHPHVARIRLH